MKYSFMTFSTPDSDLKKVLGYASQYGYDGVELRIDAKHKHGVETDSPSNVRAEARRMASDAGIAFSCVATSCKLAVPEDAKANRTAAERAIELAADIGAPTIRVFGGQFSEATTRAQASACMVEALVELAPKAQKAGVVICAETHDAWCEPAHLAAVMREVDHAFAAINWDIMHPVRAGGSTMDDAFRTLKSWIRHVHFHDGTMATPSELKRIGTGAIDHRRAVELLMGLPYKGFLSGEWINYCAPEEHLQQELAVMKEYESALG